MQPSPYTPGEIAPEVPGRDEQLSDIDERLSYLADLGRFVGRIRVDTAPRGLGKTSMLAQVERMAEQRRVLTIWTTGGESEVLMADIAAQIADVSDAWAPDRGHRLRDLAETTGLKVRPGVPGIAHVEASLGSGERVETGTAPAGGLELATLVRETVASALREQHSGLVLLIDEIQDADQRSLSALGHAWQDLQRERQLPAAVFAAGLPNTDEVIRKAVSFSERFAYRPLGLLPENAARAALVRPAQAVGVTWSPDSLEEAVSYAQGFPFTIQLLGEAAWKAAGRPDPGARLTTVHVAEAKRAIETDLDTLYRARWNAATPAERTFVTAMASLGDTSVGRGDIARALGVPTEQISQARDRLITKGIIRATERGRLGFTINGFAEYVRTRTTADMTALPSPSDAGLSPHTSPRRPPSR